MQVKEAEREAIRLLEDSWPSGELPVNPFLIAEALGIQVTFAQLPRDESGRIEIVPDQTPRIWINRDDAEARQRFTCAHEIGHYRRRAEYGPEAKIVDYRDTLAGLGTDEREIFANQFAAALLMPADRVAQFHRSGIDVNSMARIFGTSAQAMGLRLRNLSLA